MIRRSSGRWLLFVCLALAAIHPSHPAADDAPIVASEEDAYIAHAPNGDSWTIGNASITLTIGFDTARNLVVQGLTNPTTGDALDVDTAPDTTVTLGGDQLTLNQSNTKMTFLGATAEQTATGVRLTLAFQHRSLHTTIKRVYACYGGTPTIEAWTRLEAPVGSPAVQVSGLIGWQLTMPNGPVQWINGLRGDNASQPVPPGDSFAFDGGDLTDPETDIGSTSRSSEAYVPLLFVQEGEESFYGGVIWSGAWRMAMIKNGDRLQVVASFPNVTTSLSPDRPLELPHTFFGYANAASGARSAALRQFVMHGLRLDRPIQPLVTYNTWYPYGAAVTEDDVNNEMAAASQLGVELFVLDAGWWTGAGALGSDDYTTNLGLYTPDADRFPDQLSGMADQAHALGMKFGLWVEPERIALSALKELGGNEQWLATANGSYNTDGTSAQLCLADNAARKWLLTRLVNLIDAVHPDYLKWDNNFWINCDRAGHGHGTTDGSYAHVLGLYALLDDLRRLYPDLLIENVSGGGNRLDYGMSAYTDAAWMDDSTAPSAHVRHNLEGLSQAFPPEYLLSFVIQADGDSIYDPDLANLVRSRMPGVLGLTYQAGDLDDDLRARLAAQIAEYKLLRDTVAQSAAGLLTQQAPVPVDDWDVLQEVTADRQAAIIFGFKSDGTAGRLTVRPANLDPNVVYDVRSLDNGELGAATGADIMRDGIELVHSGDGSLAHVITLSAQPAVAAGSATSSSSSFSSARSTSASAAPSRPTGALRSDRSR